MPFKPPKHDPRDEPAPASPGEAAPPPLPARASSAKRGYGRRWRKYREWFLRQHPTCATPGCNEPPTDVDHVRAVTGPDDPGFWETDNHRAFCHSCHSRKTVSLDGGFGH